MMMCEEVDLRLDVEDKGSRWFTCCRSWDGKEKEREKKRVYRSRNGEFSGMVCKEDVYDEEEEDGGALTEGLQSIDAGDLCISKEDRVLIQIYLEQEEDRDICDLLTISVKGMWRIKTAEFSKSKWLLPLFDLIIYFNYKIADYRFWIGRNVGLAQFIANEAAFNASSSLEQTATSKDIPNPLIAIILLKDKRIANEAADKASSSLEQTATSKDMSNPLIAITLLKGQRIANEAADNASSSLEQTAASKDNSNPLTASTLLKGQRIANEAADKASSSLVQTVASKDISNPLTPVALGKSKSKTMFCRTWNERISGSRKWIVCDLIGILAEGKMKSERTYSIIFNSHFIVLLGLLLTPTTLPREGLLFPMFNKFII